MKPELITNIIDIYFKQRLAENAKKEDNHDFGL